MHSYNTHTGSDHKPKAYRSEKYLKFIRSKKCIVCGKKAVAAHVRKQYWMAGIAKKPHDYVCISLCDYHHKLLDSHSVEYFDEYFNINIKRIIIDNLIEYITRGK